MPKAAPKGQRITLDYIARHFQDENEAYLFLESLRWPNGPVCVHCQGTKAYFLQPKGDRYTRTGHATQRRVYKCAACRKQFSVLIGTIFEGSKIPLYKWLLAIHLMCSGKNGVAAFELHRTLQITYKSAWFMCHRIRKSMEREPLAGMLMGGTVEADETYTGGRPRQRGLNEPKLLQVKRGWLAKGEGWAVDGPTKEEAVRRYREAERRHQEIDARLFLYQRLQADSRSDLEDG